jgi:hypothetical protein
MTAPRHIQLDAAFTYQQAAISAVHRAFAQSHGDDFATDFVHQYRVAILTAAKKRLCGSSMCAVATEASRLSLACQSV